MPGLGHGNGVGVVPGMGKESKMGARRWGVVQVTSRASSDSSGCIGQFGALCTRVSQGGWKVPPLDKARDKGDFLGEWTGGGSFDRDKDNEKIRWVLLSEQRGQSSMAAGLHLEIMRARQA